MEKTKQWDGWSAAGSDRQGGRRRPPLKGGFHPLSSSLSLSLSLFYRHGGKKLRKNLNKELREGSRHLVLLIDGTNLPSKVAFMFGASNVMSTRRHWVHRR